MRLSTVVTVVSASLSQVYGRGLFGGKQDVISLEDNNIPGESPLELCPNGNHSEDIIQIDKVDLLPNPPRAGTTLVIDASGIVKETIEDGAYVMLSVKYGLIKLINTKADLCEQIKNVDMECPIEKGKVVITKNVDLPKEIPPGKYTVVADVYTKDDVPITCITAVVVFSRGGGVFLDL